MIRSIRVPRASAIRTMSLAALAASLAACASTPTQAVYSARSGQEVRDCLSSRLGEAGGHVAVVGTDRRGYALSKDVTYEPGMSWTEGTRVEVRSGGAAPSPQVSDAIAACV